MDYDDNHHAAPPLIPPAKTDGDKGDPHQSMDESGQGPRRAIAEAVVLT
jgi:hypothetical protein